MTSLLALWRKEWLALARDVHGLAVLFLMPAAFIVVMSLALSDVFEGESGRQTSVAVLDADSSALSRALAEQLTGAGYERVQAPADADAARAAVRAGTIKLLLIVPTGFERSLAARPGQADAVPKLTLLADPALPSPQLAVFQQRVLAVTFALRMQRLTSTFSAGLDAATFDPTRAADLQVEVVGASSARPSSVQQNVPAWLIFGMFFVVMPIASLFVIERREGTLARLVSQQVPFTMLLLGKVGPFFVINLIQAGLMVLAGRSLVPLLGGEVLALPARWDLLLAVTASTSFAAIGWGLLVAVCVRTMEQATVIGGVGNILMAAIGGIMVPKFVMPQNMQTLADFSPMAWALDGFHAVILRQAGAAAILTPCLKLLVLAAILLGVALWVHRWQRA